MNRRSLIAGTTILALTAAFGFIPTTEAAWAADQRFWVPVVLGVGFSVGIFLVINGVSEDRT